MDKPHSGGEYRYIGKRIPPLDAYEKVLGAAEYTFDLEIPGMFHVKLVHSEYAHARIKSIDYSKAIRVPGVVSVITGRDIPYRVGIYVGDRDLLAIDKVLWIGHPVAAVVAENLRAAEKAAELIEVEYDPLEPVFSVEEALRENAPILHENLDKYRRLPAFNPKPGTNIANYFKLVKGDIDKGFAEADTIVRGRFKLPYISHAYMEPQVVIAWYRYSGDIEIWSSAQSPFAVRSLLSLSLDIPAGKIKVNVPYIGGGFGGKAGLGWEALAAMISRHVGFKPVKLMLSRAEQFKSAPVVPGMVAEAEMGLSRDGRIVAYRAKFLFDSGAFADYTVNISRTAGYACAGSYDIPNILCESYAVYTNKVPTTALRGFGHPENHFVLEHMIDMAARELDQDPVKIRSRNLLKPGVSTTGTGVRLREDAGNPQLVLERISDLLDWTTPEVDPERPWVIRSKGIALSVKGPSQPPNASSSAIVKFNEDASVDVMVGTSNFGQGTVTGLAMMVAEAFGIPLEKVHVKPLRSTDASPYTWQTVGSRGLFTDGLALLEAIEDAKRKIKKIASQALKVDEDHLEIADGKVYVVGKPWISIPLEKIVMGYQFPDGTSVGGPVIGVGRHIAGLTTYLDPETGQGNPTIFYTFGGTGVEVEINILTGEIKVLKAVQVYDIGKAINPLLLEGQAIGGFVMGMSRALYERIIFDEFGSVANPNFSFYYVARAKDAPDNYLIEFVETPQMDGPLGSRGVGENVMISVPVAIANAIYRATGVSIKELPITPERLVKAIREQRPDLFEQAFKAYIDSMV